MDFQAEITRFSDQAQKDPRIIGVMLYGSYLNGGNFRDIDLALFITPGITDKEMMHIRLDYLKNNPDLFDIQIYNLLPLVVKKDILKGQVLYESSAMYDLVYQVIREYEDFEKYLIQYREMVLQ
jgi:predicted nucleotidyltransferase